MSDYDRIAQAISFITCRIDRQPTLDEIAAHVHLSPFHIQRLFSRWAGTTPKRFLQVLTLERVKQLLQESVPLLEVSDSVGLSSSSRLYDHFVQLEAVTPGEYKTGGMGLTIEYAVHGTPFGNVFIAITPKGVCKLAFLGNDETDECLADLCKSWPSAEIHANHQSTLEVIDTTGDCGKLYTVSNCNRSPKRCKSRGSGGRRKSGCLPYSLPSCYPTKR